MKFQKIAQTLDYSKLKNTEMDLKVKMKNLWNQIAIKKDKYLKKKKRDKEKQCKGYREPIEF